MKALVTGGAGFIGSHICEALCRRGAKVVVLDNLSTGKVHNLDFKKPGDEIEFVQGEVADEALVKKLVAGCDWVFHEAAQPSVPLSVSQPVQTNRDNLDASLALLVASRDAGVKRFMFASSSAVYGDSEAPLKHESHGVCPISPYGLQKYAAERYGQLFHQLYGFEAISFRYFNVFGPRQNPKSQYAAVIPLFITALLRGQPCTLNGDGQQTRDFTFVDDVVEANLCCTRAPESAAGAAYNVAWGNRASLLDLIAELSKIIGVSIPPVHRPARAGDVRDSQADSSRAKKFLGWEPKVSFEEGLRRTVAWLKENPNP